MSSTLKAIIWAATGSWSQQGINFCITLVLARIVSPESYGIVAVAMLIMLVFQRILYESVGYAIIRSQPPHSNVELSTAFWLCLAFGSGCFLLFGFSVWFAWGIGESNKHALLLLSIIPVLDGAACVQASILRKTQAYRSLAARAAISSILGGLIAVALALMDFGIFSLVAQQIATSLISVFVLWRASDWRPSREFSFNSARNLAHFSLPMAINALVNVGAARADLALSGALLGPAFAGYYALAKRTTRLCVDVVAGGIGQVALTGTSQVSANTRALYVERLLTLVAVAALPCFVALAGIANVVFSLTLGPEWQPAIPIVQVLCVAGFLQSLSMVLSLAVTTVARPTHLIRLNLVSLFLLLLASVILVNFSTIGVAIAVCIQSLVSSLIYFKNADNHFQFRFTRVSISLGKVFLAGAAMALTMICIRILWHASVNTYVLDAVSVIASMAVYLGIIWLLLRPEMSSFLKQS